MTGNGGSIITMESSNKNTNQSNNNSNNCNKEVSNKMQNGYVTAATTTTNTTVVSSSGLSSSSSFEWMDTISTPLFALSNDGLIIAWNSTIAQLTQLQYTQVINLPFKQFIMIQTTTTNSNTNNNNNNHDYDEIIHTLINRKKNVKDSNNDATTATTATGLNNNNNTTTIQVQFLQNGSCFQLHLSTTTTTTSDNNIICFAIPIEGTINSNNKDDDNVTTTTTTTTKSTSMNSSIMDSDDSLLSILPNSASSSPRHDESDNNNNNNNKDHCNIDNNSTDSKCIKKEEITNTIISSSSSSSSSVPIFVLDGKDLIVYEWNSIMTKITGYNENDVIGKKLDHNIIHNPKKVASCFLLPSSTCSTLEFKINDNDNKMENNTCSNCTKKSTAGIRVGNKSSVIIEIVSCTETRSNCNNKDVLVIVGRIVDNDGHNDKIKNIHNKGRVKKNVAGRHCCCCCCCCDNKCNDNNSNNNNIYEMDYTIQKSTSCAIFGIDTNGCINIWNEKAQDITGKTIDDVYGKSLIQSLLPQSYRDIYQLAITDAIRYGRCTTCIDLHIPYTDGRKTRYLYVSVTPLRSSNSKHNNSNSRSSSSNSCDNINDNNNSIHGALFIALDVTDISRHDRAIVSMASELRQLIDTANAPIFGIDIDGDVNEWNEKTSELTGYLKEEAFDRPLVNTFIVPHLRQSVQDVFDNAIAGLSTSNFELEFRTKTYDVRHLLVNATTRRDGENNVVGVVCVAQDVTEAVQRDCAVAGMALELRQLIDTANAPIFGIDVDGNVNEWNRRTREISGYSREEAFDLNLVKSFIAPHMQKKVQEILKEAIKGNETSNYELEFITKSGESRFMLVNATTRRDPEGKVVGVVGVAQDVTEDRKQAAELRKMHLLQAAQEAKVETERNMTAYFAHELRNPLSAIDSALSAMPDDLPESAQSLVEGMQLCSSFMSAIMNNLLDVRKMEEGKMLLNRSPVSLKKVLKAVHTMLSPSIKPGVSFVTKCNTQGKDWVLGDEHRMQQIMTNVVTNAIKYTIKGSIILSVEWENDMVKFECVDSGPGIPKSDQTKLFQRFVQRGGAPGTGLGLAISKHLVDLIGGSIVFESDPTIKAGTTCIVRLPLELCEMPDAIVDETDKTKLLNAPLKFLIVDDVKMNRLMLKKRIEKSICSSCSIWEASTGEAALEICGKEKFDVIVVDQYMEEAGGVMVGTDVIYAMRRMRIDSIIIGCSGNDLEAEFGEAGADWVWQKPMPSNQEIISHLRAGLKKKYKNI